MGLKNLFIVSEDDKEEVVKKAVPKEKTSFPSNNEMSVSPAQATPTPSFNVAASTQHFKETAPASCAPYMEQIMSMYEQGFEKLNKPGIEFYEFYEAVVDGGINQPIAYKMALKILSGQEPNMTKESLLSQSQYYIDELQKVYETYTSQGTSKYEALEKKQEDEINNTNSEIASLTSQMENLQKQINLNQQKLKDVPAKYSKDFEEIQCKMQANEQASKRIVQNVQTVISGINTHL